MPLGDAAPDRSPGADQRSEGSRSLELLDRLEGLVIAAATVDEQKLDLTMTFDNGVLLRVDPTARPSRLVGGYTVRIDRVVGLWEMTVVSLRTAHRR
jgi:hypothetical protein